MSHKVGARHQLKARLTTPIPAGWDADSYARHLKRLGNPVVRAEPEYGVIVLAELEQRPPLAPLPRTGLRGLFNRLLKRA